MRVEGLLFANLYLVTLLSSEQCFQFQMLNKTSSFKKKLTTIIAEASRVNRNTL